MYYWSLIFLAQQPASSNPAVGFILPLAIVAIFYVLVFMPMQRQKKQQQRMLTQLQNGNVVLTSGGIVGTIITINEDDTLILRVRPDNIKLQVSRNAITGLVNEASGKK
ncbi:MAG TPA: preprotein translocase subunit YajC [Bryobacteraceae bacterium]|nr:preprotein translocase subunit YajC [Bryobacteraceae bacterium]